MNRKFRCTNNLAAFLLSKEAKQLVDFVIQQNLDFSYYNGGDAAVAVTEIFLKEINSPFQYISPTSGSAYVFISSKNKTVVKFNGTIQRIRLFLSMR